MAGFQSTVSQIQGFSVPGEIFQDAPWVALSWTLNSSGTPNIVGATAYTVTSEGFAEAGSGGSLGFAGILCIPKDYSLLSSDGLSPSLVLNDYTQATLLTQGILVITLPGTAAIGDLIIYDNDTGELSSASPDDGIPDGFSFANATVSQFTPDSGGSTLAVIDVCCGGGATSSATAHTYERTYWAAANGLAGNDGTSIERPFNSIQAFIDAVAALDDPTAFCVLNIPGVDLFTATTSGWTFPTASNIFINAPGASFETAGTIGLFRGTGGSFKIIAAFFSAPGNRLFTWGSNATIFVDTLSMQGNINNDSGTGASMTVTSSNLTGSIVNTSDLNSSMRINNITGAVTDTSPGGASLRFGVFARTVGGAISSTEDSIYGQVFDVGGSVSGIGQGIFDGTLYNIA